MAEKRHVQHVRSKVVEQNGQPKLPQGSDLLYGEFAVNYHKGTETISLKNDQDEIVAFHDEVEITSGSPKINTEIWIDTSDNTVTEVYTKSQIDSFLGSINDKDNVQDGRLDVLEAKTSELSGETIDEIKGSIEALEGIVETKVDNSSFNDFSASTEAEIESLNEAVIAATEIQVGTSASTISSNTKVYIDTDEDASVQIYTKEQIDSQVNGINNKDEEQDARLDALENGGSSSSTKIDEISGSVETLSSDLASLSDVVANNIVISSSAPSGADTELFVDTSGDGPQFEVYTRAQVDAMIADLQRQIDELKG